MRATDTAKVLNENLVSVCVCVCVCVCVKFLRNNMYLGNGILQMAK